MKSLKTWTPLLVARSLAFLLLGACTPVEVTPKPPAPPVEAMDDLSRVQERLANVENGDLPDFAPGEFELAQRAVRALRGQEPPPPADAIRRANESLDAFERKAEVARRAVGASYQLRNSATRFEFIREQKPMELARLEGTYQQVLNLALAGHTEKAQAMSESLAPRYESLIDAALSKAKAKAKPVLTSYREAVGADLRTLDASGVNGGQLDAVDGVMARLNLGHSPWNKPTLGVMDPGEPPYVPPLPTPPGPTPPAGIGVDLITNNSMRLRFVDVSDNEVGNRILRTADLLNWTALADVGPVTRFETYNFPNTNLQPDTQYCFQVEAYNAQGARKSQLSCAYTLGPNPIGVWRVQLRVQVANLEYAGTDNVLRVMLNTSENFPTETFLDYGRDDLERNSNDSFDLNFDPIKDLTNITGITLINHGDEEDYLYIRELELLVNGRPVFTQTFGNSANSVLKLGYYGTFTIGHAELRANPVWQNFVAQATASPTFNIPNIKPSPDGRFQVLIPNDELVSRVEGLMGHLLHTDLKGKFKWGYISGPAVEVTRSDDSRVHVDLDLEATIDYWPNPAVDVDFDLVLKKSCSADGSTLNLGLATENFESDADYQLWKDILSGGMTKITADVIDWYGKECATPPDIAREFAVPIPNGVNCNDITVKIVDPADLAICCFSL